MRFHRRRFAALSLAALPLLALLAGCGGNVQGRMLHTPEFFTGESTSIGGDGSIALISNRGPRCSGPYRQVPDGNAAEVQVEDTTENGVATLTCSDGRTGSVMFAVSADQAVGTGMLGKDIVTLTIVP